jgi:hypothetical protein
VRDSASDAGVVEACEEDGSADLESLCEHPDSKQPPSSAAKAHWRIKGFITLLLSR